VRAPKESERAWGTHSLSSVDGGSIYDTKRKVSEGHSLSVECRRDRSGHRKNESKRAWATHRLWSTEGRINQDTESKQASDGHSLSIKRRRDKSNN
jgi:hypothetical protein